jgi:hypothetical protein
MTHSGPAPHNCPLTLFYAMATDSARVSPVDAGGSADRQMGQGHFMPAVSDESFPFGSFQRPGRWGDGLSNNFLPDFPTDLTDEQAESRYAAFLNIYLNIMTAPVGIQLITFLGESKSNCCCCHPKMHASILD